MYAHFLPEGIFDHSPCLLKTTGQQNSLKRPFKYFNMWGKSPYYLQCLQGWWKNSGYGTKMYCLVKKIQQLKPYFRQYNRDYFSDIENSAILALKNLEYIQAQLAIDPRDTLWLQKEQDAIGEYKELQTACTLSLSQKAKAAWIKDGDSNTRYFHGVIKSNFMKNQLLGTEKATTSVNPQIVRQGVVCNTDHWNLLLRPVTSQEIKAAIFSIPDNKAPGPDGFSNAFFKDSWGYHWY
ncbi:uncharacterized protein LOC141637406 [Silene latifolia]|uniref:uncharacterized protein LOC141637406 n=1 Tax=Silene latifolia TaxID=37657 RepID=UPI003D78A35D